MREKRLLIGFLAAAVLLAVAAVAAACGDDGGDGAADSETPQAADALQVSLDRTSEMVAAAAEGDLEAANAAFDAAHDPLHEVIDALEASQSSLAADLDEAVDDAEADLEEGEEAEHIVEIGNEILDLLERADSEISP